MPPEVPFAPRAAQAEPPVRKPATPYGIQPVPPGLVRAPGAPMDGGVAPAPPAAPPTPLAAKAAEPAPPPQALPPPARQEPIRLPARSRSGFAPAKAGRADAALAPGAPEPQTLARPFLRRHEAFCQYFVLYGNASRAAMEAGYSVLCSKNQGHRLMRRPEVRARIAEIHRHLARDFNGDHEVLLGKLEAVYRRAVDGGYLNAAARIVELQARMAGLTAAGRQGTATAPDDDG